MAVDVPAVPSQLPADTRVYAVGDIHGESLALDRMMEAIALDIEQSETVNTNILVLLGDYIDRGRDSRGVIDRLLEIKNGSTEPRFLLGNHEQSLLRFLSDPHDAADWLSFGGLSTADSYGVRLPPPQNSVDLEIFCDALDDAIPTSHRDFLQSLEHFVVLGDYVFVHAGIRPRLAMSDQRIDDLLWIREPFLAARHFEGRCVVHGHTIESDPVVLPHRIGLDTGAYASGVLSAVRLEGTDVRVLQVTTRP